MDFNKDQPIIESLVDVDMYKFTMGQMIFFNYPKVPVEFGFINRTSSVNLTKHIDKSELQEHLDHARSLSYTEKEIHYLRGTNEYQERMFREDYLQHLRSYRLPDYELEYYKGDLRLNFPGYWLEASPWETLSLSIMTELYTRSQLKKMSRVERDGLYAKGISNLLEKIKKIKQYPELTFSDFATRRRACRPWHEYIVSILAEELPGQFLGTSNVKLAMEHSLLPMGTSAHELDMVYSRLFGTTDEAIRYSVQRVGMDWWDLYGWGLSIALTDTFGSDAFFRDCSFERAFRSKGFRHDSGDPIEYGEKVIAFYRKYGIDPKDKMIVFSDGLNVETMIKIFLHFHGRIKVTFGWGTNLGNDLGLIVLSLINKVLKANGLPCVKLSDNLNKGLGPKKEQARFKRIFNYKTTFSEKCVY